MQAALIDLFEVPVEFSYCTRTTRTTPQLPAFRFRFDLNFPANISFVALARQDVKLSSCLTKIFGAGGKATLVLHKLTRYS
jgi:hypothetical protein